MTPCATCATLADCTRCAAYARWLADAYPDQDPPERSCWKCGDAEWLRLSGETLPSIAARLHMRPDSLATHLRRHGRDDLLRGA